MTGKDKTSPLKDEPVGQTGPSIHEQLDKLIDDKFTCNVIASILVLVLITAEWYRWYFNVPMGPGLATIVSLIVIFYCVPKILRVRKQARTLKLNRDGKKEVGEYLDHLRRDGCIIYHDITGDNFNLDHVVLSTKGIYAVETKTFSKPLGNNVKVRYDGDHLDIDGIGNKDDILLQTKAESIWLKGILRESTGREYCIKPVVVFPGWFVESKNHDKHWVMNPRALPEFIHNQQDTLTREDVQLAAFHLSRYIRTL